MINGETILAVIPARSGSKRCPGKNFREFRGKPLYMWSVETASNSKYIDKIKLSMDPDRPPELCTDMASSEDVLRFHLAEQPHDWILLLQPTSPLRTTEDIDACIERASESEVNQGCISVGPDGETNGAVYIARREWIEEHDFSHAGLMKYWMPEERSLDINTEADFAA
jgi:CMP-N,N'-diacetyllegionaminic acid synthase